MYDKYRVLRMGKSIQVLVLCGNTFVPGLYRGMLSVSYVYGAG